MIVGGIVRASYTFEVGLPEAPKNRDRYRDPRGRIWTVQEVGKAALALRNPPPPFPMWNVTLEGEHAAYRIEPGEELVPVETRRSGMGWDGHLYHEKAIGFGSVCQRLPGPELIYGGNRWSWRYREVGREWILQVGPTVEYYSDFHDACFERRGHLSTESQWSRIQPAIEAFQDGAD